MEVSESQAVDYLADANTRQFVSLHSTDRSIDYNITLHHIASEQTSKPKVTQVA